jgi:hypothetical protein
VTDLPAEPRKSLCIHRSTSGRLWWRVDADISRAGALRLTSGDANEWLVIVAPAQVPALLRALRREGDLTAAVGGSADDELLSRLSMLLEPVGTGALDSFKAYLAEHGIPFETQFWAAMDDGAPASREARATGLPVSDGREGEQRRMLADMMSEALALVRRDGNDFSWSSWPDAAAASAELSGLAAAPDPARISLIFAPSGPMQELAMASGWAHEHVALANRIDSVLALAGRGATSGLA